MAEVYLHKDPDGDENFKRKVSSELWDCVLLFTWSYPRQHYCLVLEWYGDVAEVVGTTQLMPKIVTHLPMERRTVRRLR